MKDIGNTLVSVLFVGFLYGLHLLLSRFIDSTVWPIIIIIVIGLISFVLFLDVLKNIAKKVNKWFKPDMWIDRLSKVFMIIGVIAMIRFVLNKKSYDI